MMPRIAVGLLVRSRLNGRRRLLVHKVMGNDADQVVTQLGRVQRAAQGLEAADDRQIEQSGQLLGFQGIAGQ